MLDNLIFAIGVTAPIFLIFCTGILLKRLGIIDNEFARMGSELAFKVALPSLLFTKLIEVSFVDPPFFLLVYAVLATVAVFLVLDRVIAPRLVEEDRGAFVQGAFRGNMGIIGLAFALNAFGDGVLPLASIYLAIMTILFNILSVITLNRHLPVAGAGSQFMSTLHKIVTNPLIIAIVAALLVSWFSIPLPAIAIKTLDYFAVMALPLALLCSGAAIRWREFHTSTNLYWGTAAKLVFTPGFIVLGGILLGFRGEALGILFFMTSAPTATASYPMIRVLGGNHYLAAAMIATTSLGSVLVITTGLFLLKELALL